MMGKAKTYKVEYRYWDNIDQDAWTTDVVVTATSAHEAITYAWPLIKTDVEMYDGTIDDLDAWLVEDVSVWSARTSIARHIFAAYNNTNADKWDDLSAKEKDTYFAAADRALEGLT